jgi:hypothetical protein
MRARVILDDGCSASDAVVRLLLLFGYWAHSGQPLPEAAESAVAVLERQSEYLVVAAPTDVVLGTLLLVIEWRNHPAIELHARLLAQAAHGPSGRPLPRLAHPFFDGMPPAYAQGLAILPDVLAILPEPQGEPEAQGEEDRLSR